MKVYKTSKTERLPEAIESCQGEVYVVSKDGKNILMEKNNPLFELFRDCWHNSDKGEIELAFALGQDANRILYQCMNG